MSRGAEVLVVGAGITGLYLALSLARSGVERVVVVERAQPGAGASGRSGGILRAYSADLAQARLARVGLGCFREWDDEVGGDCGFRQEGLIAIPARDGMAALERRTRRLREAGIGTVVISAADARTLDPALHLPEAVTHVAHEPGAGCADPGLTMRTLTDAALREGVDVRVGTEVRSVLHEHGRVTGVTTSHGCLVAANVVIAAGTHGSSLLRGLGIDLGVRLGLARVAVYPAPAARSWPHPVYLDDAGPSWFRPVAGAATLVGVERPRGPVTPADVMAGADEPFLRCATQAVTRRFPMMATVQPRGRWAGTYVESPDGRPVIGALRQYDGLFTIAGDGGASFKTAPAIGKGLADLITTGKSETVDLADFSPGRLCPDHSRDVVVAGGAGGV